MKISFRVLFLFISIALMGANPESRAEIIPIDLRDFFADPSVTVSPDGSSAVVNEDELISPVLLSNDISQGNPGLGNSSDIFGGPVAFLTFDYDFREGVDEDDEFLALVLDAQGDSVGIEFEFFTQDTGNGTVTFDIMPLAQQDLGLQFQLGSFDSAFSSSVSISNINVITPEPGSLLLFVILGIVIVTVVRLQGRRHLGRK